MGFVARSRRKMWFGTEEYATWIPTPNSGADSSPQAWNETGTFLGGDGYVIGSRNSHKQYVYEWPSSSSREDAQLMKSFYEGAYGRGKLYFVEPLIYDTNVLPAKWANPAITCGFEGPSLVPGVDPVELTRADVVGGFFDLVGVQEPLTGALYNLTDVPGTPATFTPVYENLFTNPRLKGDGTWAPAYENLFTNPRLKGDGTWAEVRRNLHPNPGALTGQWLAWWAGSTGNATTTTPGVDAPWSDSGTALRITWTSVSGNPSNGGIHVFYPGIGFPAGDYIFTYRLRVSAGASRGSLSISDVPAGSNVQVISEDSVGDNVWDIVVAFSFPTDTTLGSARFHQTISGKTVGSFAEVSMLDLYPGTEVDPNRKWFDGSTPDFSVDPDMRTRWLGTPNDSESVMEIERVAELTAVNCIAGVSTKGGKPAVRLIATSATSIISYAWSAIPIEARTSGTALGTLHLDEPLTGSLSSNALSIRAYFPYQTESAPNTAGEHPLRLKFSELTLGYQFQLYHGGRQGAGDVWWTDIGLFAGNYPYEAFNGDSDPADTGIEQPEDFRIRWAGQPDASTSVMEIERVAGLTTWQGIAGVSTWGGKPAIRQIATLLTGGASTYFNIPATARPLGTILATSHIPKPLTGTLSPIRMQPRAQLPNQTGETPPNEAGSYPQKLIYNDLTETFRAELLHGGRQGSGDVWWTDIGLFAGVYDGPAFSGSDGSVTIDGIPYSTRWDVSVSQAGIWTLDDNITLDDRNSVFIPIPEGMQLNIGANFQVIGLDNPGIYLKPITDTPSNDIYTVGQASRSNLFPTVIPAKNGVRGVRMWIGKLGDSGNLSVSVVNFIHARLSPIGKPPTGPSHWIGGQGHAGTRFALPPTYISNTGVGGGQISYAATFKESLI